MKEKIKLGDKVKDKITGYTGIVTARMEFINGCTQYTVARKLKNGEELSITGDPSIDEYSLEVVKKRVINSMEYQKEDEIKGYLDEYKRLLPKKIEIKSTGGPITFNKGMRGY